MGQSAVTLIVVAIALGWLLRVIVRRNRRQMKPIWFHERGDWDVVLHEHDQLRTAVVVRLSLDLTLGDTLKLIADPPSTLVTEVTRADGQELVDRLQAVGAKAELRPTAVG